MSAILLDSGIVHYEVIGRGRPIIFVHGWVGSWRYWIPALQTASTNFRAYALDLWGFGDSAREEERYSLDKQVELIDRFLNEMGIGRVALVGHGLGGLVSLLFAARSPQVVDRVMAVDVPLEYNAVSSRLRTSTPADLAEWLLARTPAHEPARADAARSDSKVITASFTDPNALNIVNRLYQGTTPVLLVYGQNDPAITVPQFDPMTMPEMVHSIVIEQTGHFPMLDDTATFNRLLTDWTALESGESPRDLQLKEEWRRRIR
jgi:pimeloyl-ACP methyl ester carboxylesterase